MELRSGSRSYIKGIGALPHQNITTQIKILPSLISLMHRAWVVQRATQNWKYRSELGLPCTTALGGDFAGVSKFAMVVV